MKTIYIGKKRRDRKPIGEIHPMLAMPTPVGWGEELKKAHAKGYYRLEKGEIPFERLSVRLFKSKPRLPEPVEDKVIGTLDDTERRAVLPMSEQLHEPEPPRLKRTPISDEIADYCQPGDSDIIRDELLGQMRTLTFRIVVGTIIAAFLGAIELLPYLGVPLPAMFLPEQAPAMYLSLNLLLTSFMCVLCGRVLTGGIDSLRALHPDGEGILSLSAAAVLLHMLAELVYFLIAHKPVHRVCGAPLVLALLINDIGLLLMTRRVARNFSFIALRGSRKAARIMSNDMLFDEIIHGGGLSNAQVTYSVHARFLANYLNFAYREDFCEQMASRITPYVALMAAAAGVFGGLVSAKATGVWGGIYCMCATLITGVPICRMLCLNMPMAAAAKRLLRHGTMLNGWSAIDTFGRTDSLALDAVELFPAGTVRLINAKAFGEAPIERSIRYAAAVVLGAGGPLAQVFDDMLGGSYDMLPRAEHISYENEMGLSGFVESLPVLVGNRAMLERHGCASPSRDYEDMLRGGDNRELVYIAIGGVPCAVMLVHYTADPDDIAAIQDLVESGVALVVCTCDSNVTARLVSSVYGIPTRFITILSTRSSSEYEQLTHTIRDKAPAVLCTNGSVGALADGITAARKLRPQLIFSTIIQMVCYGLGLTLVTVLYCISGSTAVQPWQIMLLQLICTAAASVSMFKRLL